MWLGKDNQGQEDSSYGRLLLREINEGRLFKDKRHGLVERYTLEGKEYTNYG
jgi:hypothetical protein